MAMSKYWGDEKHEVTILIILIVDFLFYNKYIFSYI
uniref:Uncharacterized protein n=1 Tax=Heterorhabditis bacteriophora TaxID=37862 RepID=A0A1I7W6W0_HETBA